MGIALDALIQPRQLIMFKLFIMKRLSLKRLKLRADDLLPREQLKTVIGGGGTCGALLPAGSGPGQDTTFDPPYPSASQSGSGPMIFRGVSRSEAESLTRGVSGARWCCTSCGSASWY